MVYNNQVNAVIGLGQAADGISKYRWYEQVQAAVKSLSNRVAYVDTENGLIWLKGP